MRLETFLLKMICITFLFLFLLRCDIGNVSVQGGTETGDAVLIGYLIYEDGTPASNALAKIVPAGHDPYLESESYHLAVTDSRGKFSFDTLETGFYNLYGEGNKKMAFDDSIYVDSGQSLSIKKNILKEPGSLKGVARLQGESDNRSIIIIVIGSNTLTVPLDSAGNFLLNNLPEGRYTVRFLPTRGDFNVLDTILSVKSGESTQLADTILLINNGLPTPKNLTVAYDTATQTASLSWTGVEPSRIAGYNIYRSADGSNFGLITRRPVDKLKTSFQDTGLAENTAYEYRVVSIDAGGKESEKRDGATDVIFATPRGAVKTNIAFSLSGNIQDSITGRADSVLIKATYDNPVRTNTRIAWYIDTLYGHNSLDSQSLPVKDNSISAQSGADSLMWAWKDIGWKRILVRLTDEKGNHWQGIQGIQVIFDSLKVFAGTDTTVRMGAVLQLSGSASQKWGAITKWEWNINGDGFVETTNGDTNITLPDKKIESYPCILRVTDNNGFTDSDTIVVKAGIWRFLPKDNAPLTGLDDMLIFKNQLYITGEYPGTGEHQLMVKTYLGNNWSNAGGSPLEAIKAHRPVLANYKDTLYAAYLMDRGQAIVKKLEDGAWSTSYQSQKSFWYVYLAGEGENLFLAAVDYSGYKLTVLNLVGGVWTPLDSGYNQLITTGDRIQGLSLALSQENLLIAYLHKPQAVKMLQYHIPSKAWQAIPHIDIGIVKMNKPPVAIWGEQPVIAVYKKDSSLALKSYNGTQWVNTGNPVNHKIRILTDRELSLIIENNTPYLAYFDNIISGHIVTGTRVYIEALDGGVWKEAAPATTFPYDIRNIYIRKRNDRIFIGVSRGGRSEIGLKVFE